ncbi:MAG: PspC domain-containing protein [Muribaculaceae bacterium]|nr:PspC domain-containing protein [Muribaculaceae bacterium]
MKKTYNINLAGLVFTMDDDAYDLLNNYLDTLQHAFRKDPDAKELIADIEGRAAELLAEHLGENRQVVTLADVETVIAQIGRPEEMMEEEIVSETRERDFSNREEGRDTRGEEYTEEVRIEANGAVPPPYSAPHPLSRKLFRDPQNAMIGGVCAGLAAYLKIDVTWVRLLTVALCFISLSTAAIAYIILWIVLPEARTPLQRMQMNGEAPTIENIGRTVTDNFKGEQGGEQYENTNGSKRFIDRLAGLFGILAKVVLICLILIAIPVEIALILGLIGCLFALVLLSTSWGTGYFEDSLPFTYTNDAILGVLTGIGIIIVIGIPLLAIIWMVVMKNHPITRGWKISLVTIWIVGFLLGSICAGILVAHENMPRNVKVIETETEDEELRGLMDDIDTIVKDTTYEEYVESQATMAERMADKADRIASKAEKIAERAEKIAEHADSISVQREGKNRLHQGRHGTK